MTGLGVPMIQHQKCPIELCKLLASSLNDCCKCSWRRGLRMLQTVKCNHMAAQRQWQM